MTTHTFQDDGRTIPVPSVDDLYGLCSCGAMLFSFDEARAHLSTGASVRTYPPGFHGSVTRYLESDHVIRVVAPDPEDPEEVPGQTELPGLSRLYLLTGWDPDPDEHEEVA